MTKPSEARSLDAPRVHSLAAQPQLSSGWTWSRLNKAFNSIATLPYLDLPTALTSEAQDQLNTLLTQREAQGKTPATLLRQLRLYAHRKKLTAPGCIEASALPKAQRLSSQAVRLTRSRCDDTLEVGADRPPCIVGIPTQRSLEQDPYVPTFDRVARLLRLVVARPWRASNYLVRRGFLGAGLAAVNRVLHPPLDFGPYKGRAALVAAYIHLLERDLQNVADGYYPASVTSIPLLRYAKQIPAGVLETLNMRQLRATNDFRLPPELDDPSYPAYYRRKFHWQKDGWFSKASADQYDAGVEDLFLGVADVMRRMTLRPLIDSLRHQETLSGKQISHPRILDVACGTGRFLAQLHKALPHAKLSGIDLSPHYVEKAKEECRNLKVALHHGNAEAMSAIPSNSQDGVTCIFLFHELPKPVRRNVLREILRVLKPGASVVICDSSQVGDAAGVAAAEASMTELRRQFAANYHEPFYTCYTEDPLEKVVSEVGFIEPRSAPAFWAKTVIATKPHS